MFLGPNVHAELWSSRYVPQLCSSVPRGIEVIFLGHKYMFLGFWLRNICLFLVVIDLQVMELMITEELGLDSEPCLSSDF
jgi:hypothetical protein